MDAVDLYFKYKNLDGTSQCQKIRCYPAHYIQRTPVPPLTQLTLWGPEDELKQFEFVSEIITIFQGKFHSKASALQMTLKNSNAFAFCHWSIDLMPMDFDQRCKHHFFVIQPGMENMNFSTLEQLDPEDYYEPANPEPEYTDPGDSFIALDDFTYDSVTKQLSIFQPCRCKVRCPSLENLRKVLLVLPDEKVSIELEVITSVVGDDVIVQIVDFIEPFNLKPHRLYVPLEFQCTHPMDAQFLTRKKIWIDHEVVLYTPANDPNKELLQSAKSLTVLHRGNYVGEPKIKAMRRRETEEVVYGIANDFVEVDEYEFKQLPVQYSIFTSTSMCVDWLFDKFTIEPLKEILERYPLREEKPTVPESDMTDDAKHMDGWEMVESLSPEMTHPEMTPTE